MRIIYLALLAITFSSCHVLKIASDKNAGNTKEIGIGVNYGSKANNEYTKDIQASVDNVIQKFNSEKHAFAVHTKTAADNAYMTLDFSKIKIASNGQVTAGYIVSGLGLIVTPIAVYALSNQTFLLAFYYFPSNKLMYQGTLSPSLDARKGVPQSFMVETGAMFRSKEKRLGVTKRNFEDQLYKTLLKLEKQLKSH